MSALERRLSDVERQAMPSSGKPLVFIFCGGPAVGDPTFAKADELQWERVPGESFESFKVRAVAEASAAGKAFVFIGGRLTSSRRIENFASVSARGDC